MESTTKRRTLVGRALGGLAVTAFVAVLVQPTRGGAEGTSSASELADFDARGIGSVAHFSFHVPEAVFPFQITGGMLESTSVATSSPRAYGAAGLAPVPVATSVGLIIPKVIPGTDIPIPDDVQEAFKSIDFTALPNGCQATFPPVREGDDQATCGGPDQRDAALGFTAAGLNGRVTASGSFDEPFATRTTSISRGGDVTVPGLQARFHGAYSEGVSGVNGSGLPQARSVVEIDSMSILGKLLHIEGIRSESVVATDGTRERTVARSSFTVRSASVTGIPVTIGPDGVSLNKNLVPASHVKVLTSAIEQALAQGGGLRVRIVPAPPVSVNGTEVTSESDALEISYRSQQPTPVDVAERIAFTRSVVNAVPAVAADESALAPTPPSVGSVPTGSDLVPADSSEGEGITTGAPLSAVGSPGSVSTGTDVASTTSVGNITTAPGANASVGVGQPREGNSRPRRVSPGRAELAARQIAFDHAARVRLRLLYGGLVVATLVGVILLPLRRTLVGAARH